MSADISAEESARIAAISAEEAARISAVSSEASARAAAVSAEVSRAEAAEAALSSSISQEVSNRQAAVSAEASARAAAVSAEQSRAESAEAALSADISAEASARAAEDLTFFKKDGSRAMTGAMDMASYAMSNVGDVSFVGGMKVKQYLVSANYSIVASDYYIGVTDVSVTKVITLPSAATVGAGKVYVIKDHSGEANQSAYVSIAGSGSEKVDGQSSFDLKAPYESVMVVSDGSNWFVM